MSDELKPIPSFWSRLGRAFVNILRFVLILVIIAGIGAGVYFGAPYLYEKFILPVETNTARLSEVESKQAADVKQLNGQITDLKTRILELENHQTANAQSLAELQGQLDALESAVNAHSETFKQLKAMQATLDMLLTTSAEHEALLVGENSILAELQRQVMFSRTIELLSRARLYLSQSNFGLARQDVQAARDLLAGLQSDMPADKSANLQGVIARLDLALGNLPDFPVIAVDDVDTAWQMLVNGLSDLATPTPQPTIELLTSTTEAPATATPTPAAEITPTATP